MQPQNAVNKVAFSFWMSDAQVFTAAQLWESSVLYED